MPTIETMIAKKLPEIMDSLKTDATLYINCSVNSINCQQMIILCADPRTKNIRIINLPSFFEAYRSIEINSYLLHIDLIELGTICSLLNRTVHQGEPYLIELLTRTHSFKLITGDTIV